VSIPVVSEASRAAFLPVEATRSRRPGIVVVLDFRAFVPSGRPDLTLLGPAVGTDLSPARRARPSVVLMESVMLDLACCVDLP
jgi:hypothetical protein